MPRKPLNGSDIVDQYWPVTGPSDIESITAAAAAIGQLHRYLAHATFAAKNGLQYADDGYTVMGILSTAARSHDQTLRQIAGWADRLAVDPALRADDGTAQTAQAKAVDAAETLREAAQLAGALSEKLGRVWTALGPLYHDSPQEETAEA